jgi:hypothetical protein
VARTEGVVRAEARRPGFLRVRLAPLEAGTTRVVSLPIPWTVSGALEGLGAVAYPLSRPAEMTVLAPRDLPIE